MPLTLKVNSEAVIPLPIVFIEEKEMENGLFFLFCVSYLVVGSQVVLGSPVIIN